MFESHANPNEPNPLLDTHDAPHVDVASISDHPEGRPAAQKHGEVIRVLVKCEKLVSLHLKGVFKSKRHAESALVSPGGPRNRLRLTAALRALLQV